MVEVVRRWLAPKPTNPDNYEAGISPGERIALTQDLARSGGNREIVTRAPDEPGTYTVREAFPKIAEQVPTIAEMTFVVKRADPRKVDTADADQQTEYSGGMVPKDTPATIDVSSKSGTQGAANVEEGISPLPRPARSGFPPLRPPTGRSGSHRDWVRAK